MVKKLFLIPLIFITFFHSAWAAEFSASVDRTQISEQDTLNLVLRIDEQILIGSPNLAALENDFTILGQSRSQQMRSVNGVTESFTQWSISLMPKRKGQLQIPALTFKGSTSAPIQIEVKELSPQVKQQQANDFFFETSVSPKDKLIVQQQIQYTEKLYYAQNHQDAQLNEVKVTDARVQQLGETKNYTTVINGRRFGVYERTFAIYPEVSGELVIPGQRFNATVANPYDRWSRGRPISVVSKPIYLQIAPIPANYPQDSPWLVTPELSLEESYSNPSNQWKVGEAVTRIITIKAKGINASQLPQLALPQVDGLRTYADKNHSEDQHSSSGQIGISEQAIALVPSAAGEFTLPAIKVPWWNVQTQQIEYASLPAKHVQVQGAASISASALSPAASANELTDGTSQNLVVAESSAQFTWLNGLMALLLLASVGLNLWLLTRQPKAKASSKEQEKALSQKALWQQFSQACAQNNPQLIRQTLIQWANAGGLAWLNTPIHNLHQLVQQSSNQALNNALQELDQRLYSQHHNSAYNGQLLKRLVAQAQQSPQERTPSLYPL